MLFALVYVILGNIFIKKFVLLNYKFDQCVMYGNESLRNINLFINNHPFMKKEEKNINNYYRIGTISFFRLRSFPELC